MTVRFEPSDSSGSEDPSDSELASPVSLADFAARRTKKSLGRATSAQAISEQELPAGSVSEFAAKQSLQGKVNTKAELSTPRLRRVEQPSPLSDSRQQPMTSAESEQKLIWALNRRAMSVYEAKEYLKQLGIDELGIDEIIEKLSGYGYLNDAAVAEQHLHRALRRKVQSVQAVRREMQRRGINESDIANAIEQDLDDDYQRALEFAQKRAVSMRSLDPEVAQRRLFGQLSRRGFPSSLALEITRIALSQ